MPSAGRCCARTYGAARVGGEPHQLDDFHDKGMVLVTLMWGDHCVLLRVLGPDRTPGQLGIDHRCPVLGDLAGTGDDAPQPLLGVEPADQIRCPALGLIAVQSRLEASVLLSAPR